MALQYGNVEVEIGFTILPFRDTSAIGTVHKVARSGKGRDAFPITLDRRSHNVIRVHMRKDNVGHILSGNAKAPQRIQ